VQDFWAKWNIADLGFQIVESELSHRFDLDAFIAQVGATKKEWESNLHKPQYDAP
jgi:hypothetical protein